jgi:hypothetical protein
VPIPLNDDDSDSGSSHSVGSSHTGTDARATGINRQLKQRQHRVTKSQNRSGSIVDPRAVARAFDSGALSASGFCCLQPVGNVINSFADGTIEAAQPGFNAQNTNFVHPAMPSFPLPSPPRYDSVHPPTVGFAGEHGGEVSGYPYADCQAGSTSSHQFGPLHSSPAPLPSFDGYVDQFMHLQAHGDAPHHLGEPGKGQMIGKNGMMVQYHQYSGSDTGLLSPSPSQHEKGKCVFVLQNPGISNGVSSLCSDLFAAPSHAIVDRQSAGRVELSEGFTERFPPSPREERTSSDFVPGTHGRMASLSLNCNCGKDCDCLACPEHPDNVTTRDTTAALGRIMDADGLQDRENLQGMLNNNSYGTLGYSHSSGGSPFPTTNMMAESAGRQDNAGQTFSPWLEQGQHMGMDVLNEYFTYEIPVAASDCTCGDGCLCSNCPIHTGHASGSSSSSP